MIVAFAVPALLISAGAQFEQAVSDSVTIQVSDRLSAAQQGVGLTATGRLTDDEVSRVRDLALDRLSEVEELGPSVETLHSFRGQAVLLGNDAEQPAQVRAPTRFFSRAGAIESLDIVQADPMIRGVYVSEDLAERAGAVPGSTLDVVIDGAGAVVDVEGIYRNLWPRAPSYWDDVPQALVPRFSRVFNYPNVELLIARDSLLLELGLPGLVRWDAPLEVPPRTLDQLTHTVDSYRNIERELVTDAELVAALEQFAGLTEPVPTLDSSLPDALAEVRTAIERIDQPFLAAQAAGLGIGLLVVMAAAAFTARQQAVELRLQLRDGDSPLWLGIIGVGQFATPALVGATLGAAVGLHTAASLVPGGIGEVELVPFVSIAVATLIAVLIVGAVRAFLAVRFTEAVARQTGQVPVGPVLVLAGLGIAGWVQVGRSDPATGVDPLAVAFPIVALTAFVGSLLLGGRWLIGRSHRAIPTSRPILLFALRRLTAAQAGLLGLAGALGVALGMIVFVTLVNNTRTLALESKATTLVGAQSRATLPFPPDDPSRLPSDSTVIRSWSTRLSPGSARIAVVAIDPATFGAVVDLPETFGLTTGEVLAELDQPAENGVLRAIVVGDDPIPARGAVGTNDTYPYEVVSKTRSVPLAISNNRTLLVSATSIEQIGRVRFEADLDREFGAGTNPSDFESFYRSPIRNFRTFIVSQSSADNLAAQLADSEVSVQDIVDRRDLENRVDEQATTWAFGYLRFTGAVAAIAATAATILYVAEQSDKRRVRARMARHVGMPTSVSITSGAIELTVLSGLSLVSGIFGSLLVANRVMTRFDPLGDVRPRIGPEIPWAWLAVVALSVCLSMALIGFTSEWFTARREHQDGG
jgi:hypothetical protein